MTEKINLDKLKELAASDCNHYVLLTAMRIAAEMSVPQVAGGKKGRAEIYTKKYYNLKPIEITDEIIGDRRKLSRANCVYRESSKDFFERCIGRIAARAKSDPNLDEVEFVRIAEIAKAKYNSAYAEYKKSLGYGKTGKVEGWESPQPDLPAQISGLLSNEGTVAGIVKILRQLESTSKHIDGRS